MYNNAEKFYILYMCSSSGTWSEENGEHVPQRDRKGKLAEKRYERMKFDFIDISESRIRSKVVQSLGIIFDPNLTMTQRVKNIQQ